MAYCTRLVIGKIFVPYIRCLFLLFQQVMVNEASKIWLKHLFELQKCAVLNFVLVILLTTVCCFIAVCMFQSQHGGNSAHPRAPCLGQRPPCHRFGPVHVSPQLDDGILPRGEQWRGTLASPIWWGVPAKPPLIHILTRVRFECHWGRSGLHLCPQHTRNGCQRRGGKFVE